LLLSKGETGNTLAPPSLPKEHSPWPILRANTKPGDPERTPGFRVSRPQKKPAAKRLSSTNSYVDFMGSIAYIMTDGQGTPTLDLSANVDTRALFVSSMGNVQLGTRDSSGPTEWYVEDKIGTHGYGVNASITSVVGSKIPEPTTLLLATTACLGLMPRRRRPVG
jgi:hypothetical protein